MAEVVVWRHPEKAVELVLDTEDIASFEAPIDVRTITCAEADCPGCLAVHRVAGTAHLNLTFKPGKRALWREIEPAAV